MKILNQSDLAVIIPVYNESRNLENAIEEVLKIGAKIIIVDDGSSDNSENISKKYSDLIFLQHSTNLGYVKALNTGFEYIKNQNYKYVATFDADGQLYSKDLYLFLQCAKEMESDLVVGYRSYKNRLSESVFAFLTSFLFKLRDPFCGLKLYKVDSIINSLPFDSQNLVGAELLFKSYKKGLKIHHISINVKKRKGPSRFANNIKGELIIIKASFKILAHYFTSF